MTNEQIKKLLYNYPKFDKWITDYEKDLDNIREQLDKHYSVNASVISDMPRGTDTSDKTFDKVCRIDRLKELYIEEADYIASKLNKLYKQKRRIEEIIPELTPTQQFIVESRYFNQMSWADVVEKDPQHRTKKHIVEQENSKLLTALREKLKEGN